MKRIHLKRAAIVAGLAVAAMGAALLVPGAAQAQVSNPPLGSGPGQLTLTPNASTDMNLVPTFQTSTPCPAPNNVWAGAFIITNTGAAKVLTSTPVQGAALNSPFGGSLGSSGNDMLGLAGVPAGQTYEIVIDCRANATTHGVYVQSTFITFNAAGTSWSTSSTPPAGATATTTTLSGPSAVAINTNVTINATVAPAAAAGTVQFLDNGTPAGAAQPVSGGTATFSTTYPTAGTHTFTAQFTPTDPASFGASTAAAVTVIITSGNVQTETINVNVPASQGPFIMTVSTTPVSLGTATLSADYTKFTASGTLSDVTVSDERNQTVPGWTVTGQMGNFSDGTHTIPGSALGWVPAVKTQNPAADVVAGSPVAATAPGLATASPLASALAGKGLHTSVLNAALSFQVPSNTQPGAYSGLLTVTAIP